MKIRKLKIFQIPIIKQSILFILNKFWLVHAKLLSDKQYIRFKYFILLKKWIDFDNPILFQEKLQWIKLNDRKEIYHNMVDKLDVKEFIKDIIGDGYTFPTLGVWNSFEGIDFNLLPNKFILKCTHDSGSYFICKDKSKINLTEVRKNLLVNFDNDYYIWSREFPYKGLERRIIAEPLIEDEKYNYLRDFKFMCFNGEPKLFYITSEKQNRSGYNLDYFDLTGNHLEIEKVGNPRNLNNLPLLPSDINSMVLLARKLAEDTYFLRVDFYEVNNRIYVGELTFFDFGGFGNFSPKEYNKIFGDWIKLPIDKKPQNQ